ncbi:MAG: glycosyltransferase family 2 protein [Gammaproteobacteria bacterium]
MPEKNLCIIIPVLNRWEQTQKCLAHLRGGSFTDFNIIVVDHGSTDGTREGLKNGYPDVMRVPGTTDLWWTGATNLGIRTALEHGADLIMLLNNDCYVAPDTIETLLRHSASNPDAIIAPVHRNLNSGEIITRRGGTLFLLGFPTLLLPGRSLYKPDTDSIKRTSLIMGGRGTLIPADIFASIGLFNEAELPHYWADHDFFLRCKKQGIRQYIAQNTLVDIDERTTSLANRLQHMKLSQFIDSLKNRRSHRNIKDLGALFRLHYPIPGLYPLGVFLNMARYTLVYLFTRAVRLASSH